MTDGRRMRLSLRTALLILVVASIVPFGLLLHFTWWRTATGVSRDLVDTLESQITEAVRRAWWGRVMEIQGLSQTLREALAAAPDPDSRERILVASATASPILSWLVHIPPEGESIALEELGPQHARVFRTDRAGRVLRSSEVAADGSVAGREAAAAPPMLAVFGQSWMEETKDWTEPGWIEAPALPNRTLRGIAYVDRTGGSVLAAMIGYERFARLLGEIPVGKTGRSYVLGPDGVILIASEAESAPRLPALDPVALAAGRLVAGRSEEGQNISEKARIAVEGARYAVGLSPLWYKGWQLAVIVPEAEFLGPIDATIRRVALGLAVFVAAASLLGVIVARRLLAVPIARVVEDLALVERFELERVPRRLSRLAEIDRLSEAIVRMSAGLADFAKFIPTDLVRSLLADGVRAEPGGSRREVTVLFADLAGFTGLSERLGDGIVPLVGEYLDLASRAVAGENGTVDKFIGDAVMAFWGAPRDDADQALHACRAALAICEGVGRIAPPPGTRDGIRVRIGLHSGPAIVGNIGSPTRLNYTALGDTVNLASRLEGVNKIYGTTILLSGPTREMAGERILVRALDTVAVYGRSEGVRIYELLGLSGSEGRPAWVRAYEEALSLYRERRFEAALQELARLAELRPDDGPAERLASACRALMRHPPSPDWRPVTVIDAK
jgi:adenylate cyclase